MVPSLSRRQWLKLSAAGVVGASLSGWIETLAADAAADPPATFVHPALDDRRPQPDSTPSTSSRATPTAARTSRSRRPCPASRSASTCP